MGRTCSLSAAVTVNIVGLVAFPFVAKTARLLFQMSQPGTLRANSQYVRQSWNYKAVFLGRSCQQDLGEPLGQVS